MTATHRKKPIEIEARQLTRENGPALWEWADSKPYYGPDGKVDGLSIYTLEGRMKADFGDWIIKGIKGEFYPCKPDVFEASYEAIDAEVPQLVTATEKIATITAGPGLSPGTVMYCIDYAEDGQPPARSYARPDDLDSWRTDLAAQGWTIVDAPSGADA